MVGFRVQAKRLYRSLGKPGQYGGFKPGSKQIDNLISKAGQANPIYVFYNHPEVSDAQFFKRSRQPDYFGRSCWGCSVATADFMKSVKDARLSTVIAGQVPWHRFFGIGKTCRSEEMMKRMEGDQEFRWADSRPLWVDMLLDERRYPNDQLNGLLNELGLTGVAYFGYS